MIDFNVPIPPGIYSVSFQSYWHHPNVGKNSYDHYTVKVHTDCSEGALAAKIAEDLTNKNHPAKCTQVRIMQISQLLSLEGLDIDKAVAI